MSEEIKTAKKKRKKWKLIFIMLLLIIIIIITYSIIKKRNNNEEYITAKVERKNLIQTVSETGTIKSANEIELNFLNTGRIDKILVSIGDKVSSSQILAKLDYSDLNIELRQKQAQIEIAKAKLNKLLNGATNYEIAVYEANAQQAKTNYESSIKELEKIKDSVDEEISQAEINMETEINNKKMDAVIIMKTNISKAETALDKIDSILNDNDIENLLSVKNTKYLNLTKSNYNLSIKAIQDAKNEIELSEKTLKEEDILTALNQNIATLNKTFDNLNNCYDALENTITSTDFTISELNSYKTDISNHLVTISSSISNVETAKQTLNNIIISTKNTLNTATISGAQRIASMETKVNSYYEAWQVAQTELSKLKAPANYQDIALAQAELKQAQAGLDAIKNKINKSIIKAPIEGQITKIEYEIGEQVSLNKPVIYLLADNNLEIELDISESDINKVRINDPVEITLDAFDEDQKFSGKIISIEPAETIIQNVIYYKTKISFDFEKNTELKIKPGMTANVTITTAKKENVLVIPSRAIIEKDGQNKFVRIFQKNRIQEIPITTNLYGDDGLVEIKSGLKEGEEIITYVNKNK